TDISKSYYGNKVLKEINFDLNKGEVLGLVGENGAGKSTLIKILSGVVKADTGTIKIDGEQRDNYDVKTANEFGISVVFQELSLANNLTVADNIFIGNFPQNLFGAVDKKRVHKQTNELLKRFDVDIKSNELVGNLSIGKKQIVEILKAVSKNPKVLILDEPTSSLEKTEIDILFSFIRTLKNSGYSIIYITHFLEEVFTIVDRVFVLRDGSKVGVYTPKEIDEKKLIELMINQDADEYMKYEDREKRNLEEFIKIENLTKKSDFEDFSVNIKKGEILGIAGVVGCGKDAVCKALAGVISIDSGNIYLDDKKIIIKNPVDALQNGIVLLPENRKTDGLFLDHDVKSNIYSSAIKKVSVNGWIREKKVQTLSAEYRKKMSIRLHSLNQQVRYLSGGNQQKILLAKCIAPDPMLLIAMDPTRGIDVKAKKDIHTIFTDLADKGYSILMISSDLEELLNVCDRVVSMVNGKITAEFERENFNLQEVLLSIHKV
ncbi:MAG: sugar ABC transporter ATP-binding protein, partial [Sphaerochaetaceae bacterium]